MSVDLKTNEWILLRDQFRALVHNESGREYNLEQFVDAGIRRRFGDVMSRACLGNGKQTSPLASENDHVELGQAQLLRRQVAPSPQRAIRSSSSSAGPGTVELARAMWNWLDRLRAIRGDLLTTAAIFVVVAIMLSFIP